MILSMLTAASSYTTLHNTAGQTKVVPSVAKLTRSGKVITEKESEKLSLKNSHDKKRSCGRSVKAKRGTSNHEPL